MPGVRFQNDSDFGFRATPKINVMFSPSWIDGVTTNARLSYGNGYRVPSLKERYFEFDHSILGYKVLGNTNLNPEQSHSYQLGIEIARSGLFSLNVDLFYNRIKDLIESELTRVEDGIEIFTFENIAQATTKGIETTAEFRLISGFNVSGGVTYMKAKDLKKNEPLVGRPHWIVKLGVDYTYKPFGTSLSLYNTHQSKEWKRDFKDRDVLVRSSAWTTWDIKLNQRVFSGVTLFAGVDNITNEHRDPNDRNDVRPYEPRLAYLGLRIEQ